MFEIYSIGDSQFLEYVLNAVAMICGTGDFVKLVSIGLVIGIIIVCVQSILMGVKELNFQQILVGWLMYACFFYPSVTVTIEDAYTGQVRVVDNVPIGVGFAGSMISNVGYGITELFEQAYAPVASVTGQPFAEPLRLITAIRSGTADNDVINVINQQMQTGDLGKSLDNYIRECTMMKVAVGEARLEDIYTENWQTALRFDSEIYGTRIYIGNNGQDLSCSVAWGRISQQLDGSFANQIVIRKLNELVGATGPNGIAATTDPYNEALLMLGKGQTAAQDFIKASFLEPIYLKAAQGYYKDFQDVNGALMINQAISQRNTQWAAEQSLFMTVVRPMMTFFEGFIYAITPLMGFLFVLGTFGMRLGIRYFQTVLWIQLWMPVLSICNLYVVLAANGQISTLGDLTSFYAIDEASRRLENWLATGGMLAASTPIISLFLVTGSTYAFTTLASRLGGGDHINEKIPTNDVVQPGAYYQRESFGHGNSKVEAMASGAENAFKQINMGDAFSAAVSSSRSIANSEVANFAKSYSEMDSRGFNQAENASFEKSLGQSLLASNNKQAQAIAKHLIDTKQVDANNTQALQQMVGQMALKAAATGGMSLGLGFDQNTMGGVPGARGGINAGGSLGLSGSGTLMDNSQKGQRSESSLTRGLNIAFGASDTAELREAIGSQLDQSYAQSWAKSLDNTQSGGLSEQFNKAEAAVDKYEALSSHSEEFSATKSQSSIQAAAHILGTEGGREAIAAKFNEIRGTELGRAVQDRFDKLSRYANTGGSQETRAAALLEVMSENGDLRGVSELTSVTGKPSLSQDGSGDNAGLIRPTDHVREVSERVSPSSVATHLGGMENVVDNGRSEVQDQHREHFGRVVETSGHASQMIRQEAQSLAKQAMANVENPGIFASLSGAWDKLFGDGNQSINQSENYTPNQKLYMNAKSDEERASALEGIKNDLRQHDGLTNKEEIDEVAQLQANVMDKAKLAGDDADRYMSSLRRWNRASNVDVNYSRYQ